MKYFKLYEEFKETISFIKDKNCLSFYLGEKEIGYVEYEYDGTSISEHLNKDEKEFYLSMIEIYPEYRGNDYSSQIIDNVKKFAKELGATIITLRVDYGMGFGSKRNSNKGLEKLYLSKGFEYSFTEEETQKDDTKNLGAMYYHL
jgi:GNAT superfamily N-acetyltransferase